MNPTVPLGDLADLNPRAPSSVREAASKDVVFLAMPSVSEDGSYAQSERRSAADVLTGFTYFARGDVLLAKITPCMENGKATHLVDLTTEYGFGSTEFHVLRPKQGIEPRFVFHAIWNARFRHLAERAMTGAAGQKRVPADFVRGFAVPKVSLDEQRRIASVLDQADSIRRKRREALKLTDALLRSTFLEMFGDPVTNPKGWPTKTLDELEADFSYGTSTKCGDDPTGHTVLRIPNVAGGEIDTTGLKYAKLTPSEVERFSLGAGDLLFVRSNGNPNYIARCAVFSEAAPMLFASYLIRARLPKDCAVSTRFVHAVFSAESFRQRLLKSATTTAGNYNINTKGLGGQRIPLPPPDLQARFLTTTARILSVREKLRASQADAEALCNALAEQFFSPSPSSSKREAA